MTASGDLCGVRACANLGEHTEHVPLFPASGSTITLALCHAHHRELRDNPDPIDLARAWVLESIAP